MGGGTGKVLYGAFYVAQVAIEDLRKNGAAM
jgi:hypothetical protein